MKKALVLIAVLVVCAAGVSFAVARWVAARSLRPTIATIHDPAWLKRELNLTDEQLRQIEALETTFRAKLDAACVEHCAARMTLGEEIAKSKPDVEQCRARVERMNAAAAEGERATLEHILKVRALLDEQQAQRYSSIIHQQVCNMPMGAP
jgi:Spy/CpxP family protein refolding chaperone